jgi:FkbM family methyltransferase
MTEELEIFQSLPGVKVVFDVGARTDNNYSGEVHRFEPNPEFSSKLTGIVNRFGLADFSGEMLYYPSNQSFVMKTEGEVGIPYPVKTLDEYANDIPVDFIKIDAEGMDYRILLGGKETLKRVKYIQFEYWDGVKKFRDLLTDFNLYLILDSALKEVIQRNITKDDKYNQLMIPLDQETIDLIDDKLIPLGAGGNIFGIRK